MYLFSNFLTDPKEYAKAEKLWCRTLTTVVKQLGQQKQWKIPWIKPRFVNGTPYQDGNPILTAIDRSRRLVICIIQTPYAADGEPDLIYWTDKFAKGDPEECDKLVISCVLSDETLAQAIDLMTKWATQKPLDGSIRRAKVLRTARTPMPHRDTLPRA
jgi:hypothetical protein